MKPANTSTTPSFIIKRNGAQAAWDTARVRRAIGLALLESRLGRHLLATDSIGQLSDEDSKRVAEAVDIVVQRAAHVAATVEAVQDISEEALIAVGEIDAARRFMAYRAAHAARRPAKHGENGMQEYVGVSRYCRYNAAAGRRETWGEAADRVSVMHKTRFADHIARFDEQAMQGVIAQLLAKGDITPEAVADAGAFKGLGAEIDQAFQMVAAKEVLPSMRSLQFGGKAIEVNNARMFNCSFTHANRPEFFREYFWLLLSGCGVGFSVQQHHVDQLPALAPRSSEIELPVEHHIIEDTIEGWANAADRLFDSYTNGYKVEFSYHLIRRYGALLKTTGGRAPGHIPLKRALDKCSAVMDAAAGRRMRPIEVYDVAMHLAKAVLSGGVRRSATICLFSVTDVEMMSAKTGDWLKTNEQRTASNNSAVVIRNEVTREQFDQLFRKQKEFGEPGFYFTDDPELGCNPCVEINLNSRLVVTPDIRQKLVNYGYTKPLHVGQILYGVQMCNLTTLAGGRATTPTEFFRMVRSAATIGTLQADYTDMPFLGPVTRVLNEREALIGVSICGVLDNPSVLLDPATLRRGSEVVKATNAIVAAVLGINRAARTCCVKPEGTASLVLGCGSGISPHHARRYFRRVQGNVKDPVCQWFAAHNPHMVERSVYDPNGATCVISFPVEGPVNGLFKDDLTALRHLEYIKLVQENWVMAGRAHAIYTDGHHNVSNTVDVSEDEWDKVADYIFDNRHVFTGVAMMKNTGDKAYKQAPREALTTDADIALWNTLKYQPVKYELNPYEDDETGGIEHRGAAVACAGGACSIA